jgi:hypothetical protein
LLGKLTDEKAGKLADRLIKMATGGNLAAVRELYDRTMGKAVQYEIIERIEALEAAQLSREK